MIHAVVATILGYLVLVATGFGPALVARDREEWSFGRALNRAPSLALAGATVLAVLLVSFDLPIRLWAVAWLALGLLLSGALAWTRYRSRVAPPSGGPGIPRDDLDGMLLSVLVLGLLVLPIALGGLRYWILRGNGTDAFNYALGAHALQSDTFSFLRTADVPALLARGPWYPLAADLLLFRWGTSALLGLFSTLASIPAVHLTTCLATLFLASGVGPLLNVAAALGIPRWAARGLAVAFGAGFWAQLVLDMSAMSHLHSIPLLLLVLDLLLQARSRPSLSGGVSLALAGAALAIAYVEILPFVAAALALFAVLCIVRDGSFRPSVHALSPIAAGVVCSFVVRPELVTFLRTQLGWGSTLDVNWHKSYFDWLYRHPLAGFWGLHFLDLGAYTHSPAGMATWGLFLNVVGACLVFVGVAVVIGSLLDPRYGRAQDLIASFAAAGVLQTVFLLAKGLSWAAAKSVTYGFPFMGLLLGAAFAWRSGSEDRTWRVPQAVLGAAVTFWLGSQCWLALFRDVLVWRDREYPEYLLHHVAHRQYDWDVSGLRDALAKAGGSEPVGLLVRDSWLSEYLELALDRRWPLVQVASLTDRTGVQVRLESAPAPRRFIVDKRLLRTEDRPGTRTLAENGSVRLVAVDEASSAPDGAR